MITRISLKIYTKFYINPHLVSYVLGGFEGLRVGRLLTRARVDYYVQA